jgi:hypothetical protein
MSGAAEHKDTAAPPRHIDSRADGEALIKHLFEVMEALLRIVEQETELVRAGKLTESAKLEPAKTDLSNLYVADSARIKANQKYLQQTMPELTAELRSQHEEFRAVLQMNLTVLATAHAVSESIMRGVSAELARKATPQGYRASGHAAAPPRSSQQPLTLSRVL